MRSTLRSSRPRTLAPALLLALCVVLSASPSAGSAAESAAGSTSSSVQDQPFSTFPNDNGRALAANADPPAESRSLDGTDNHHAGDTRGAVKDTYLRLLPRNHTRYGA